MRILLAICSVVLVYGFFTSGAAVEVNQYEFKAALGFDRAIDIAVAGDRILVLSPGTLSVLDGATTGPVLNRVGSIILGTDYSLLAADGDVVAVASRDGEISIYQFDGVVLERRAEYSSTDSVICMRLVGDELCLAEGYDGVKIIDVSDPSRPRTKQSLNRSDYSQEVDLAGEFLYVLDALNGVEVYVKTDGAYQFLDEILSDIPLTSISTYASGVAIAFGTEQCEVWKCSPAAGCVREWVLAAEFPVNIIAGSRDGDTTFYLGSESGRLAVVGGGNARSSVPYPIDNVLALKHSALYSVVVLDRGGGVTAFGNSPILATKVSYDAAASPSAIVAVDGGLLVSTATGIQSLSFNGGNVDSRLILPGTPITKILAESDQCIFTGSANDGVISRFVNERGRWKEQGGVKSGLTLRKLSVRGETSDEQDLIAVGDEGVMCYRWKRDGSAIATCSLTVDERISCADVSDDWLVTTTENGEVNLYAFVQGDITQVGETRCAARPRDVVVTPEGVVVVAHSEGIDVFEIVSSSGEFVALESPAAIPAAFDLSYDEISRELLVASGATPAKYLDFSTPARLGTVFLIAGTEGTSQIEYHDGGLYCLSSDWVKVYQRRNSPIGQQRSSADFQSVAATPNPFNSDTQIAIQLTPNARLPLPFEVSFVNLLGQTLSRKEFVALEPSIVISLPQVIDRGTMLPSGVYFLVVRTSGEAITRKLLLLK